MDVQNKIQMQDNLNAITGPQRERYPQRTRAKEMRGRKGPAPEKRKRFKISLRSISSVVYTNSLGIHKV